MDPIHDLNQKRLYQLMKLAPQALESVKTASWSEITKTDLPPHCYADPVNRTYPVHTKEATLVSAAYFWRYFPESDPLRDTVQQNIEKAASLFSCKDEVEQIKGVMTAKREIPEDAYIINENGHKAFPVIDAASLKKAAEYFYEHRTKIRYPLRRKMAEKILEKKAEYQCGFDSDLTRVLQRSAGRGTCRKSEVLNLIRKYAALKDTHAARYVKEASAIGDALEGVVKDIEKRAELAREERISICELLDRLDARFGLIEKRSSDWPLPEDVLFGTTDYDIQEAKVNLIGSRFTGRYYPKSRIHGVSVSDLQDWLGEKTAEFVTKDEYVDIDTLSDIVDTDPNVAKRFDAMVQEVLGLRPVLVM